MPVWSIIIALCLLIAFAVKLAILGDDGHLRDNGAQTFPMIDRAARLLSLYVIALCAINLVSVVLQCGLGECHTFGYRLLK